AFTRAVPCLRHLHLHRADPGQHFTLGLVAIAHDGTAAALVPIALVRLEKRLQLRPHRLANDPLRALADQVAELVSKGWIAEGNNRILPHRWRISLLLISSCGKPNFSRNAPPSSI